MTDVLEIIKSEHGHITELFEQIKEETGKQQRKLLFNNIRYFMDLHLYTLESVFFPALRNYEECQTALGDSHKISVELRKKLEVLEKLDLVTVDFENKLLELKNHFENHVSIEEEELFPAVRRVLHRSDRDRLGHLFRMVEHEREEAA